MTVFNEVIENTDAKSRVFSLLEMSINVGILLSREIVPLN
jgi:hypothetical protein